MIGLLLAGVLLCSVSIWRSDQASEFLSETQQESGSTQSFSRALRMHEPNIVNSERSDALENALIHDARASSESLLQELGVVQDKRVETTRGIIVFLPANNAQFERELKSLLLSIAIMRTSQPMTIKTDLLVFTPEGGVEFAESLGCVSTRREAFDDPERCIIYNHVPLKDRFDSSDVLKNYTAYVDSMLVLAEFTDASRYDMLMRSDLDTFVTPGFASWTLPSGVVLASGHGAFGSPNAFKRLEWISREKLGLGHSGLRNVGSTWYGYSNIMVAAAKLTLSVMRWLESKEFSEYEKYHSGNDGYPHWHYPIMLLYAGNIAINQLPVDRVIAYVKGQRVVEMDYRSDFAESLTEDIKHLHNWHTSDFFSKFKFHAGEYAQTDLTPFQQMDTCQAYAGTIAISSDRLSVSELRVYIEDRSALVSGAWKRLKPSDRS